MSHSYSTTETWSRTHARKVGGKVAADLRQMQQEYGQPSDVAIDAYLQELVVLLPDGYVDDVVYGYKRDGAWIVALKYTADMHGNLNTDDRSGRIPRGANVIGATFYSFLTGCNLSPAPVSGRKRTLGYENGHESPILPNPSVSAKARSRGDFQESTEVWHWIDPAYTFSDGCRIAATGYMESAFFFPSVHPSMSQSWELRRFSLTQAQKSWIVGAPERLHPPYSQRWLATTYPA